MDKGPSERSRLYFLLAWFHAVVLERVRYAPIGWTKKYEFSEADQQVAMGVIDVWVDRVAKSRAHVAPSEIPWDALRTILGQSTYGGRIDNPFDQQVLESLLRSLFVERSFDVDFALVPAGGEGQAAVLMPEGSGRAHFVQWVDGLAASTPVWLGLSSTAEAMLLSNQGGAVLSKWLAMQEIADDDEATAKSASAAAAAAAAAEIVSPSWMRAVERSLEAWQALLPSEGLREPARDASNVASPVFRFLERECSVATKLIETVSADVAGMLGVCHGTAKSSNRLRDLLASLAKDAAPKEWTQLYTVAPAGCGVWVKDFCERVAQLQSVLDTPLGELAGLQQLNLGKFFFPEAFITATRQDVARQSGASLEDLRLQLSVGHAGEGDTAAVANVGGLVLEGAGWDSDARTLTLASELRTVLPVSSLSWVAASTMAKAAMAGTIELPVYLNSHRTELLFLVDLSVPPEVEMEAWRNRGAALVVCEGGAL